MSSLKDVLFTMAQTGFCLFFLGGGVYIFAPGLLRISSLNVNLAHEMLKHLNMYFIMTFVISTLYNKTLRLKEKVYNVRKTPDIIDDLFLRVPVSTMPWFTHCQFVDKHSVIFWLILPTHLCDIDSYRHLTRTIWIALWSHNALYVWKVRQFSTAWA